MEVLDIEQGLSSKAAKEDIRHDLTFYTPTCRDVRVKVLVGGTAIRRGRMVV